MKVIKEGKSVDVCKRACARKAAAGHNSLNVIERGRMFPIVVQKLQKRVLTFANHNAGKLRKVLYQVLRMERNLGTAKPKRSIGQKLWQLIK